MLNWKFIVFALFLFSLATLAAGAPQIITAAEIPGARARLGTRKDVFLILPAKGFMRQVEAPIGRVRVTAWLRFNGKGTASRLVPYMLKVNNVSSSLTVDALDSGQPLTCEVLNANKTLTVTLVMGKALPEAIAELHSLKLKTQQQNEDPEKGPEAGDDPAADAEGVIDALATPLPIMLFDRLEITQLSGPLIVSGVRSDRITYAPGAKGTVSVALKNLNAQPETGMLTVVLTDGLSGATPLFSKEVTVNAGAMQEQSFIVDFGATLWGRGLEAQIANDEGTDRGAHAVSIINNPWMCALHGRGLEQFGSQNWTEVEAKINSMRIADNNMTNYDNCYEAFAWAPCDFSNMTIDHDGPFFSGQTQYCKSRLSLATLHQVFHQYGLSNVTYGKSCACGLPGVRYALAHPEQMNVFGPAGFAHEAISTEIIDRMLENRFGLGGNEDQWQYWMSAWTAIGNIEAADFGVDEIARSAKQFDWDAVRYDGHFNAWQDPAMAARVVKHAADRLRKQIPGFGIGYNYMGPQDSTPQGAFGDAEMAACAYGGGLIMSEYYRDLVGKVRENIEQLRWGGDAVRLHGGYFLTISDEGSPWNAALMFAGGARPMGGNASLHKFATRFSSFILDPAMRRLQQPERVIKPVGKPGFLWDSFIYEKPLGTDSAALILQLVNVSEKFTLMPNYRPPTGVNPPQANVEFQLTLPAGYTAEGVFACDDYQNFTPRAATLVGNRLTIPRVALWTMAVVKLKKTTPRQSLADICIQPISFDGKDTLSLEDFRAQLQIGAAYGPDTVAQVKQGKCFITPEVLDAIFKQGEPVNAAPGEKVYQPVDFATHHDGVDSAFATPATPLSLQRNGRPDIHFARGIFSHLDRLEEAFARVKNVRLTTSSLDDGRNACGAKLDVKNICCLTNFPAPEALGRNDLLVLDEVPATSFTVAQRRQIRTFVENGGSLLLLGGWYALSRGSYEGSYLEEILPITTVQRPYLLRLRGADQLIKPSAAYAALLGAPAPSFGTAGAVEWMNHLQLKPGAQVLLTAGTHPLLIAGAFGKGRVVVFAGSHSGAPPAPYWDGQAWTTVIAQVTTYLTEGSQEVSPPDTAQRERIAAVRASLDKMKKDSPDVITEQLKKLLSAQSTAEARYVADYLLENPSHVLPEHYDELIDEILPFITPSPEWQTLGEQYMDEPPQMLERLVAEIAAVAVKKLTYDTIKSWQAQLDEVTYLRCLAACGDKAALPFLHEQADKITRQEVKLAELIAQHQSPGTDLYKTRLLRPYVAYARIRCGERTAETLSALCRGLVELPFYAWRQRWVWESTQAGMKDAQRTGDPLAIATVKSKILAQQRAVSLLNLAVAQAALLFKPEVIGRDELGKHAAASAIRDVDCRKALPLCLAYLDACTPEELKTMGEVNTATLDSIKFFYRGRVQ